MRFIQYIGVVAAILAAATDPCSAIPSHAATVAYNDGTNTPEAAAPTASPPAKPQAQTASPPAKQQAQACPTTSKDHPTLAVLDFSTTGLTANWWGQFQPGVALSDLVTDQLVNCGSFRIVDRKQLDDVLKEHKLSSGGETSPATLVRSGRLIGARYLITGNILQLEKTGQSNAGAIAGALVGGTLGGLLGGVNSERVTLKVQVRVVDTTSGVILQSFADEQTKKGTSWGAGGLVAGGNAAGAGAYSNSQFVSSTMGHLINDEAAIIVQHIDPSKFRAVPPPGVISGRVIEVDGNDVILNIGSAKNVQVGQYFNVVLVKHLKDPDTGNMLTTELQKGTIQIVTVSTSSSTARRVDGTVQTLSFVRSQ